MLFWNFGNIILRFPNLFFFRGESVYYFQPPHSFSTQPPPFRPLWSWGLQTGSLAPSKAKAISPVSGLWDMHINRGVQHDIYIIYIYMYILLIGSWYVYIYTIIYKVFFIHPRWCRISSINSRIHSMIEDDPPWKLTKIQPKKSLFESMNSPNFPFWWDYAIVPWDG